MLTNYYTLWTLLNDTEIKHVQVPIIQRDYAQGRDDDKTKIIRTRLVSALYQALEQQQPLTLDFVYGELDPRKGLFIPLDGQQRLTTLFLLHWYLALVDGELPNAEAALRKFTYETRSSSRAFCLNLVTQPAPEWENYTTLSAALQDTTWYQPAWERDPTVAAMLTMLDSLAEQFGGEVGLFARLTDETRPLIGFYFLDMPQVGLTDDLYLKMNARGKPLTAFENWKAEFDLLLQRQHSKELRAEFGEKMDGDWTDFFWKYRQDGSSSIDDAMEQYLHYLTRMLAYQAGESSRELTESRLSFEIFERVYVKQENVKFLFRTLDFLASVEDQPKGIAGLLERLLTLESVPERVRLFGDSQVDVFKQCLQEINPTRLLQEQILLFGLLTYGATVVPEQFSDVDARNLLRTLRNLLERVRQQNDTQINSNLRVDDLPAFAAACAALATADGGASPQVYERLAAGVALPDLRRGVDHERAKAQLITNRPELAQTIHELENQVVFRGDLHNLLPADNEGELANFGQAVREIWSGQIEQDVIIRAWLTLGDYSISQGKWTGDGEKYFFGNDANWYTVLAFDSGNGQNSSLPAFLRAYTDSPDDTPLQKLNRLITDWLGDNQDFKDWRYYFIKYPEMTANSQGYFAWNSDFSLRLLYRTSVKGKHINPYVRTILRRGKVTNGVVSERNQLVNDSWLSPLWLNNIPGSSTSSWDIKLHCLDYGWLLTIPENYVLLGAIETNFGLQRDASGNRWLRVTADQDRIERAEQFIEALYKEGIEYIEPEPEPVEDEEVL